ncbi:YqzE family protein [Paenibacillus cymbidii]|uniref:YqzE family protein n=1 Tax=Paenibacillus cymbidii TaxID=1639034 RepID=UPI00107FDAD5|nr:YqzE family protein [Paenibacillus cymbidii]
MSKKTDEYVKYVAERVTLYIDTPKSRRRELRASRKAAETWSSRWFGMLPAALGMWMGGVRSRFKRLAARRAVRALLGRKRERST